MRHENIHSNREAQTNELRRAHRSATNKRDADRIKAVYLLSCGKPVSSGRMGITFKLLAWHKRK